MKDDIRRAVLAAPRGRLAEIGAAMWKAWAAGAIDDEAAGELSALIEARKALTSERQSVMTLERHRVGSRPRSPESMERRRRWTASGWLPPQLACRFTMGETAVLATIAAEVARSARCEFPLDKIAALAGVSRSTVKSAVRQAKALGLLDVEVRPIRPFHHLPNAVRITSPEWRTWISMRRASQGGRTSSPSKYTKIQAREKVGSEPIGNDEMPLRRLGSAVDRFRRFGGVIAPPIATTAVSEPPTRSVR